MSSAKPEGVKRKHGGLDERAVLCLPNRAGFRLALRFGRNDDEVVIARWAISAFAKELGALVMCRP